MKMLVFFAALCAVAVASPRFEPAAYMGKAEAMGLVDEMSSLGLTTLVELIEKAGLKETLNTAGPFTIFAPTNAAIAALPSSFVATALNNMTVLVNVLKAHVIEGSVMSSALKDNLMAPSLLKGVPVRINIVKGWQYTHIGANGAEVELYDQEAKNGVIHEISQVIYPLPMGNMIEAMEMIPGLSFTLDLIKMAGLEKTLAGEGPFTIFAPDNTAWLKVPEETIAALKANETLLTEVLTYHVAPGAFYSTVIRPGTLLPTVQGANVLYNPKLKQDTLFINTAAVTIADQSVSNGVIWVLDDILPKPIII